MIDFLPLSFFISLLFSRRVLYFHKMISKVIYAAKAAWKWTGKTSVSTLTTARAIELVSLATSVFSIWYVECFCFQSLSAKSFRMYYHPYQPDSPTGAPEKLGFRAGSWVGPPISPITVDFPNISPTNIFMLS